MKRTLRVLIIEDSAEDAELLEVELRNHGYDPVSRRVENAQEMRAALAGDGWDVVLADYALPQFGGIEALEVLQASGRDVPLILVAGSIGEEAAVAAMKAGARDYIAKSKLHRLIPALERELHAAANRRDRRQAALEFAAIVEHCADAVIGKTLDGIINRWNPAAERLYGWSSAEVQGESISILVVSDRTAELERNLLRIRQGEHIPPFETVHRRKDGKLLDVSLTISPFKDAAGNLIGSYTIARDVTAGLRAEKMRRLHTQILEQTHDAVVTTDLDGLVTSWNQGAERLHGFRAEEILGRPILALYPAENQPHQLARLMAALTFEGNHELEIPFRRKTGEPIFLHLSLSPLRDDRGAPLGMIGFALDVTERKRAEAQRDELFDHLRLQVERMPIAYLLIDADFRLIGWNPAAENIFGFSRHEVLGKHPFDLIVPPQSQPLVENIFERLRQGDMAANGICENVRRDGRIIVCEWHNTPLKDASRAFRGIISLALDVTQRRQAEEAIRLSEMRKLAIVEASLDAIVTIDHELRLVEVNRAAEKMFRFRREEVLGRDMPELMVPPNLREPCRIGIRRHLATGESDIIGKRVELNACRADGTSFAVEIAIARIATEGMPMFSAHIRDLTDRKRLEEQYRQAQKMEAIGQLAAGVAHDFNNLLTVINSFGEILLRKMAPDHPDRGSLREITKAGERAAALVRQLLTFSRQQVLAPRTLDLNQVVQGIEKMLRRIIGEDVELTTHLDPALGYIKADPGQIEQVLMNLVLNARDAMPQGGKLAIQTRNLELDENHPLCGAETPPGRHVVLAVRDNGHGMTAEVKARLFEPFFTTKEKGKGTGLGLATVYGIVKACGGRIEARSDLGVGTWFDIYLPCVQRASPAERSPQTLIAIPRGTETILVAEDEDTVRSLTRITLEGLGYQVLEAAHGEEALSVAERHPAKIHLLLSDVVMPGVGGRELAERLLVLRPATKVLFLSGYTDDLVVRHGVFLEKVNFLQKPFTPAILARKVREVLNRPDSG